jgi:uncharacterized protein YidB (DUF937 family)
MASQLEDLLGGLLGGKGMGGAAPGAAQAGGGQLVKVLGPVLLGLLANGGLQKLLGQMKAKGLSSQADSWVSGGENASVSGGEVREALGDEELARIAGQVGLPADQTADALAQALPQVVDHVMPEGQVPDEQNLDGLLAGLR